MITFKIDYNRSDELKTYVDEYWSNTYVRTYCVYAKYIGGDIKKFIEENYHYQSTFNFCGIERRY